MTNPAGSPGGTPERPVTDMTTAVIPVAEGPATVAPGGAAEIAPESLAPGTAILVVKRGPSAGSRYALEQGTVTAGRHPDSQIFLDDITVSRRHAEFFLQDDTWNVRDLGSLNGTYVNRDPVESVPLASGDEVQIGKFRLVFLVGGQS